MRYVFKVADDKFGERPKTGKNPVSYKKLILEL